MHRISGVPRRGGASSGSGSPLFRWCAERGGHFRLVQSSSRSRRTASLSGFFAFDLGCGNFILLRGQNVNSGRSTLAPPPVQSRVCPGYRIERAELRAPSGSDSRFARINSSPWRNWNCPYSINCFNKWAVGRGWHAVRLLCRSRTQGGSTALLSMNRFFFWS